MDKIKSRHHSKLNVTLGTTFKQTLLVTALSAGLANVAQAEMLDIEISNLTHGIHFTPLLVTAHPEGTHLFQVNTTASSALQAMAEGGDISGLSTAATAVGAAVSENPAGGLLAPAQSTAIMNFDTGTNTHLSITAMLLPTNDGFVGLDSWQIPDTPGTYTLYLNAYDAGTEANDEIVNGAGAGAPGAAGIPANPGANGGANATGVTTTESNTMIHIHRGNVGDTDANGGHSDLDSRIHRWLNPVSKVVVTVK